MLCHLLFLWEFLPERRFAIFPKGVLAIWKNRETFSSLPASSLCLRASSEAFLLPTSQEEDFTTNLH